MKNNFKIKFVALVAVLTGTAIGNSYGMQAASNANEGTDTEVIQASEASYVGPFGTVKPATQISTTEDHEPGIPPIVSVIQAEAQAVPDMEMELPPILIPKQFDSPILVPPIIRTNPPVVQADSVGSQTNPASSQIGPAPEVINRDSEPFPPTYSQPLPVPDQFMPPSDPLALAEKQENSLEKRSVMLAPILAAEPTQVVETVEADNELAIPVIQATGEPTEFENRDVLQAAQWGQNNLARGVSAAGVPLFPTGVVPNSNLPQIVDRVETPPIIEMPPIVSSNVPPAPSIGPNSRLVTPLESLAPPVLMPATTLPATNVNPGNRMPASARIDPNYGRRQDYFEPQPVEAPVIAAPGCPTCGNQMAGNGQFCPSCENNSNCGSCGGSGCPDCGIAGSNGNQTSSCPSCGADGCYDPNAVADQFGDCGSVATARRYLVAEALYLTRRDGIISNSNFGSLSNFDWAGGLHLTIGNRRDSISGRELSYFGTDEITEANSHFDAAGRINARFQAAGGFLRSEITSFKNAFAQNELKSTELHSLEFNRVEWGWDVVKSYVGLRGIYIEDNYTMDSRNVFGETGRFEAYVKNYMIGPNFGTEIYYDVGRRISATFIARGGLYASINQVRTKLTNNATQALNVEDNNSTIGGSIELGFNGRLKVTRRANIRFGYNVLWLNRVAEASNNVPLLITPTTGAGTSDTNEMQFHGANVGFEIFR